MLHFTPEQKRKLRSFLLDRHSLTAALFLLLLAWGGLTGILGGALESASGSGFLATAVVSKADVTRPQRDRSAGVSAVSERALTDPSTVPAGRVTSLSDRFASSAASMESGLTAGLESYSNLIDLFGAYQSLSGRTFVEDVESNYSVARLSGTDSVSFVNEVDLSAVSSYVSSLTRLHSALAEKDIPLLYVQAPGKLDSDSSLLPYGVENNTNLASDLLLQGLADAGIDTLDLRQSLLNAGGSWYDWFYRTDHHWTPQAAFVAFRDIAQKLEDYYQSTPASYSTRRAKIQIDEKYLDPASYSVTTLKNYFLGSQGKRVGALYSGVDDFDLVTPAFPTLMRYSYSGTDRYGSAEETILFPERVAEKDLYNANPYTYYSGGDYAAAQVTNYYNPSGAKVLILRDSFACAITPYFAYACSQVTTVDLRYYSGDLLSYLDWVDPDVVIVLYSPSVFSNDVFFRFFPDSTTSTADPFLFPDRDLPSSLRDSAPES